MSINRVDIHAYEASLELDIMDSARGAMESTVRPWDKQRRQGRQRRNRTVAPVATVTVKFKPRPLTRAVGTISSRKAAA
jgi:hypothetical protein